MGENAVSHRAAGDLAIAVGKWVVQPPPDTACAGFGNCFGEAFVLMDGARQFSCVAGDAEGEFVGAEVQAEQFRTGGAEQAMTRDIFREAWIFE